MAHRFDSENEHCMLQSKLHRTDGVEAFDEDPYMYTFGEIASADSPQMPTTFDFSLPELASGIFGMDVPNVAQLENRESMVWPNLDISDTLDSGFDTSIVSDPCDTGDFDTPQATIQILQSTELSTYIPAGEKAMYHSNPAPHLVTETSVSSGSNNVYASPMAIRGKATDYCNQAIRPKRKRHSCVGTHNDMNDALIDKEHALRITLSVLPHPTICTIEYLARKFNVDILVVMDLCSRSKSPPDSGPSDCNRSLRYTALCSDCREYESSDATETCISVHHAEINRPSITKKSTKRIRANIDAMQEAGKKPATQFHSCTKCSWSFKKRGDLTRHIRSHFPGHLRCHYAGCRRSFYRKDKLSDHIKRKHKKSSPGLDSPQDGEMDSEDEPENTQPSKGRPTNGAKAFGNVLEGEKAGLAGLSGSSKSSTGGMNDALMDMEVIFPYSQNETASDYAKTFSRARIIRKLGQGGFGQVYELSITDADGSGYDSFACKVIQVPSHGGHQVIERARDEIKILQTLDHPNIVSFIGAFISTECIIINTRPVAECTLKEFLNKQSYPLSSVQKCQLWEGVRGLASALSYLHGYGNGEACHGDIKPENILVVQDAEVTSWTRLLLADFGSARLSTSCTKTRLKNETITPRYCAPECVINIHERGSRSDIWSFGCILAQVMALLHDKTMEYSDAFQGRIAPTGEKWTYHEQLPELQDWLSSLSESRNTPAQPTIWNNQITMISEMLSASPRERPSAAEIVSRLQSLSNWTPNTILPGQHAFKEFTKHPLHVSRRESDILDWTSLGFSLFNLGQWPDEISWLNCMSRDADIIETTTLKYVTAETLEVLRWRQDIADLESPRMCNLLQEVGDNIDIFQNQHSTKQPVYKKVTAYHGVATKAGSELSSESSIYIPDLQQITGHLTKGNAAYQEPTRYYFHTKSVPENLCLQMPDIELTPQYRRLCPKGLRPILPKPSIGQKHRKQDQGMIDLKRKTYTIHKTSCRHINSHQFFSRILRKQNRDSIPHPSKTAVSFKGSAVYHTAILFPDFVYSHIKKSSIQNLLLKNLVGFTTNEICVEISSGPSYSPIKLITHEFVPSSPKFLKLSYMKKNVSGKFEKFDSFDTYALPIGIHHATESYLRNACLEHIRAIISTGRDVGEVVFGDTSVISWKLYEAANLYRKKWNKVEGDASGGLKRNWNTGRNSMNSRVLLQKSMMLHAMHEFMSRIITVKGFADSTIKLREPKLLMFESRNMFARVLNLQLKEIMYGLIQEMTKEVLHGLDWELMHSKGRKSSWAVMFCTCIVLFMCVEIFQVGIHSFSINTRLNNPSLETSSFQLMRRLEQDVYEYIQNMFHGAYRTGSAYLGSSKSLEFNPLRDGLMADDRNEVTLAEVDFINNIREVMVVHADLIGEKAKEISLKAKPDISDHMAFRKRNSGRLVSKFLLSFHK